MSGLPRPYKIICNKCSQISIVKFMKGEIKKLQTAGKLRCPKCGSTSVFLYKGW